MSSQTVISIFHTTEEATRAKQALLAQGFEERSIKIERQVDTVDGMVTDGQMTDTEKKPVDEEVNFTREGQKGLILTIVVNDPERANRVIDILKISGATDVNEFSNPSA